MPVTIAGHQFTVPEGVLARYQIGTTLTTEGEVSTDSSPKISAITSPRRSRMRPTAAS
jgi:hypothetical protein